MLAIFSNSYLKTINITQIPEKDFLKYSFWRQTLPNTFIYRSDFLYLVVLLNNDSMFWSEWEKYANLSVWLRDQIIMLIHVYVHLTIIRQYIGVWYSINPTAYLLKWSFFSSYATKLLLLGSEHRLSITWRLLVFMIRKGLLRLSAVAGLFWWCEILVIFYSIQINEYRIIDLHHHFLLQNYVYFLDSRESVK